MWPFKRTPVRTWEERAATFPPAECGQQAEHWRWVELWGFPCPICTAKRDMANAARERELLAETIATRVAAKLRYSELENIND